MFMEHNSKYGSLYQRFGAAYRRWNVPQTVRTAQGVITVSEHSRREIANRFSYPPSRLWAIPHGRSLSVVPGELLEPERPFILALGARDPRKNTRLVLSVFESVRRQVDCCLKIVGLSARDAQNMFSHGVDPDIEFLGFVDNSILSQLYGQARLLLFPSRAEGFGFPVVDAMAHGCPVVTSNRTSLPEVAGNAAAIVDPDSEEDVVNAVFSVLTNDRLHDEMVRKGLKNVQRFQWSNAVSSTIEVYKKVAGTR